MRVLCCPLVCHGGCHQAGQHLSSAGRRIARTQSQPQSCPNIPWPKKTLLVVVQGRQGGGGCHKGSISLAESRRGTSLIGVEAPCCWHTRKTACVRVQALRCLSAAARHHCPAPHVSEMCVILWHRCTMGCVACRLPLSMVLL